MAKKNRAPAPAAPAAREPKLAGKKTYAPDKTAEYFAKRERRNARGGVDAPEGSDPAA